MVFLRIECLDVLQFLVGFDEFVVAEHGLVFLNKIRFEGRVFNQFQVFTAQFLFAVEQCANGHALEARQARTVHDHAVHGSAIGCIEQSGVEVAVGYEEAVFA